VDSLQRSSAVQEQVAELGPVFDDEPLDDYIYSPAHDRYFTPEQFEYVAAAEEEAAEEADVERARYIVRTGHPPVPPPVDPLAAAHGDTDAAFEPVTTPEDTLQCNVRELVRFDGGVVILSEVNPVSGLEQVRASRTCLQPHAPPLTLPALHTCRALHTLAHVHLAGMCHLCRSQLAFGTSAWAPQRVPQEPNTPALPPRHKAVCRAAYSSSRRPQSAGATRLRCGT
jgi:hypothetical protein